MGRARFAIVVVLAAGLVGLLAYGVTATQLNTAVDDALASGQLTDPPAFDLELLSAGDDLGPALHDQLGTAMHDGRLTLDELRGTPVVLNIWASWCKPCRAEAPVLERAWTRLRDDGVLVLGLNVLDNRDDARSFIRQVDMTYPSLREPENKTARRFGVVGVPETYFLTAGGKVAARVIGEIDRRQLDAGVKAAVREAPIVVQRGGEQRRAP